MRLLEKAYQLNHSGLGDVRIFSDRIFGYKRYYVDWGNGDETMYSGIWYKLSKIEAIVEKRIYPQ